MMSMRNTLFALVVSFCLISSISANFYGKRAMEGKTMKDIIDHIRYQEADSQSAENLLYQIAYMIGEWKTSRLIGKSEVDVK